jgi:ABC-2 type transport system permease protein
VAVVRRPVTPDRLATVCWVLWHSAAVQWRTMLTYVTVVTTVVTPAVFLLLTAGTATVSDPPTATRVVVAVGLMSLWTATVWGAGGVLRRELRDGTFAATASGVRSPYLVLLGKSLGNTALSLVLIIPTVAVVTALLRVPDSVDALVRLDVVLLVAVASGTAMGMLLACVFLLTRHGAQVSSALMYPVYLLGGLLVPVGELPAVLRPVSALISLRWITDYAVGSAAGRAPVAALLAAVGLTVLYFVAGQLLFARILGSAREDGRFDQ